jgi:YD repeat-containing protein
MTVENNSTAEDAQVILDYENNTTSQEWYFVKVPENGGASSTVVKPIDSGKVYYIRNQNSGQYLSLDGALYNGANINQQTIGSSTIQRWKVKLLDGGNYIIRPENESSYALTFVNRGQVNTNTDIEITGENVDNIDWSFWQLSPVNDKTGSFKVIATVSIYSKYLTVVDSSLAKGANVYLSSDNNTDNQKWYFVEAGDEIVSSAAYTQSGTYLSSTTDSRGTTTSYDYNTQRGVLDSTTTAGRTTSYAHNPLNDRLDSVSSGNSTVSYQYESYGELKKITSANALNIILSMTLMAEQQI